MDEHIGEFYSQYSDDFFVGNFHKVISIHEGGDFDWEMLVDIAPKLPKGWYELCHLSTEDRIQFSLDYWLSKLSYHPHFNESLSSFFDSLDDMGVFVTQKKFDDPFEVEMVYSLNKNRGFYRGAAPAAEDEIIDLQKLFANDILPKDYLAFLQIHNGFCKATDTTGITPSWLMEKSCKEFQEMIAEKGPVTTQANKPVNPHSLIPFYESFGMPYYQCFWTEWHPKQEMGNVYYNAIDHTVAHVEGKRIVAPEQLAFPTFTEWLSFYLEQVEI